MLTKTFLKTVAAISIILAAHACAINPVTGKRQLMLMSTEQEIALGRQSDPQIIAMYGLYQDEELQAFIESRGQEMAKISHRPDLPYEFKIVDSPVVNAFAVPGGFVYFTRGIMAHFNNEAEFAGVLGHEIGHITARHSAEQYTKQTLATLGLAVGMVVSEEFRQFGDLAQTGLGLLFLKFSRDNESQSDRLGVEYSTTVGYDAHQMADFFQTLSRLSDQGGGGTLPDFLSTHPNPDDRFNKVHQLADQWQKKISRSSYETGHDGYLRLIDGLVYGEDPRQGYVDNDVFYHPELKFEYPVPGGWQVLNTPSMVQMAPEDGRALMQLTLGNGDSPTTAAQQLLQQYQLTELESSRETVNGLPAVRVVFEQRQEGTTEEGRQVVQVNVRGLAYLIQYNDLIYQFLGVSKPDDYTYFSNLFRGTMTGFRELRDPSRMDVAPERVRIEEVGGATTLRNALRSFRMPEERHEELAILNGMNLDDRLEAGTLIKVVRK